MKHRALLGTLLVCSTITVAAANVARAAAMNSPVGPWSFSYWKDDDPAMPPLGGQSICVLANGTWYSQNNSMAGRWFQKGGGASGNGDRVRLLGNWGIAGRPNGNVAMELDFVNTDFVTGTLTIWRDATLAVYPNPWMRTQAQRTAPSCPPPPQAPSEAEPIP